MDDLLRFPSAARHDPAIDAWLRGQHEDLRPLVQTWSARMRECGEDVRELMHDGCPTACVGDAARSRTTEAARDLDGPTAQHPAPSADLPSTRQIEWVS